jgi:hypothetical protein
MGDMSAILTGNLGIVDMSITTTDHETINYAFHYDSRMGVGWYERKTDGFVTLLLTGTECEDEIRSHRRLWQKEKRVDVRTDIFDSIASEHTYESAD